MCIHTVATTVLVLAIAEEFSENAMLCDNLQQAQAYTHIVIAVHGFAVHGITHVVLVVGGVWKVGMHDQLRAV